jgi:DHA2 family multidrug resistance protein
LFRNLGSAIGISVVNTMLVRRVEVHRTYLVQGMTDSSTQFSEAIHTRASLLRTFGDSHTNAIVRSLGLLNIEVNRQATMLTYADCFRMLMWVSVALSPLALLFVIQRRPKCAGSVEVTQVSVE